MILDPTQRGENLLVSWIVYLDQFFVQLVNLPVP
jgi:hypothetical protein